MVNKTVAAFVGLGVLDGSVALAAALRATKGSPGAELSARPRGGAVMNKGLPLRAGQQHGHRYIPMLLERIAAGEIPTAHLATHVMPLQDAPRSYEMFTAKEDGCVRAVFRP